MNVNRIRATISFKTAVASGIIILVLLSLGGLGAIRLQSGLADTIIQRIIQDKQSELADDSQSYRTSLIQDITAVKEICAGIIPTMVYNFDDVELNRILTSYLRINDLVALEVLDADGNPFAAAWKAPEVTTGVTLPDTIDRQFSMATDVIHGKEKVGELRVFYTDTKVTQYVHTQEARTQAAIENYKGLAQKSISRAITSQILVTLGSILAMIITIVVCLKIFMVKPVAQASAMLQDIAQGEGDLTKRLAAARRDEIGELSGWFNRFVIKIQGIIQGISGHAAKLNTASDALLEVSGAMSQGAADMSRNTAAVASAADGMSQSMTGVVTAAEESAANINMVSAAAEEMTSTITEIARNTEQTRSTSNDAVQRTHQASENIDFLSQAAQEIGKIVETINDISEQTNLLALNATIEAARAGEAGKGFAVVAGEIKDLARQTAGATQEIKSNIHRIQGSTKQTVVEINEIITAITGVNDMVDAVAAAVEQQSSTTRDISQNVNQAAQGIHEVSSNIAQTSLTAQEIARDIDTLNQTAEKITRGGDQVRRDADSLSLLATHMDEAVGQFKI